MAALGIILKNLSKAFFGITIFYVLINFDLFGKETSKGGKIKIYIDSDHIQCELGSGISFQDSVDLLNHSNIEHYGSGCAYKDMAVPAACGYGTSNIYIHIINKKQLSDALDIGFKPVTALKSEYHIGYTMSECSE